MAVSEDLIYTSILEMNRDVTAMRVELTGFMTTTNAIKTEVSTVKADVSALKADFHADISELKSEIHQIKATDARRKSFIGGIVAAWSAVWTGVMIFVWPYVKEKLGL
ncbi:hypothetical protein HFO32_22105 [Rhizobium leguminosarum]|uniref:hypothetical protein n=1 Tax=Rhizobiaceae TaxID=82115 RepID=UPI000FD8DB71|nr:MULTISPECIES: hypothetical protein [Rhizobiaceae]MBY5684819.1 hypothetical protein [Rhizobium leguminosarum]RVL87682.1 hypothetical protein CN140_01755 [Sinorhizobium meliloti]